MFNHYMEVARRSPGSELTRIASRRVFRAIRNVLGPEHAGVEPRLHPSIAAWSDEQVRAAVSAVSSCWCDTRQREDTLTALRATPGAIHRALERAEAAARRTFNVFGTEVRFGEPGAIDWSWDPLSGERYPRQPVSQLQVIREGMDPKYPWALGRLDQLLALGQGYWVAEDAAQRERYAAQFTGQVTDFLDANPAGHGIQWACAMEVALRAANLAQALRMFADAPAVREPAFLRRALGALEQHARFVEHHLEDHWLVPNNHLISDYVGLLVVGALYPALPGAQEQVARALHGLQRQMELQVHPDGVSFEGSVPYHRLSVELFTLAYVVAHGCGLALGTRFAHRLRRMFEVSRDYCSERGLAPQIGDNDSGRVFPLCDRPSLEHGYLPLLGAVLFGDSELKAQGAELPDEAVWLLGEHGHQCFSRLRARAEPQSFSSPGSGLHVLRGAGAVVTVSAGPVGQRGLGGHNHNDRLSFELHLAGHPVIVDAGTATYTREPSLRNAFRSTAAHNTLEVDGLEQSPFQASRLFSLPDRGGCEVRCFEPGPRTERLVARHSSYAALPAPVQVERTFVLHKDERVLSVMDAIEGRGRHHLVLRLHLPDEQVRLRPLTPEERQRVALVGVPPDSIGPVAAELGPPDALRAVVLFSHALEPSIAPARYSPGYGEVRDCRAVLGSVEAEVPIRIGMWVLFH
ncbi:MAG TPA: alginate lyase family protein [Archangium sp.]|uniref:alginate lyase family protein n=1 Tax=Archangium sp. TaxID=1872627 RepID=UPI002E32A472|nr:alginate lyase family protein [Archangium sp.]HEX5745609.1 alginate lyase family protein [Archangium sp.]